MLIHFDPLVPSAKGRRLSDALAGRDPEDLLRVFISDLRECSGGYARYRVVERVNIDRLPVKCDGFQYSPDHFMQCWQIRFRLPCSGCHGLRQSFRGSRYLQKSQ